MLYDAFICHASEDKEAFVRPLAETLSKYHLEIWYDEFSLSVGDGLRRAIDEGLAKSRFGIVVLSPNFFKKAWPQRELDGLVARQMSEDRQLILPIWHNITAKEIIQYSPPLADTIATNSAKGIEVVCAELVKKLRPDESPLIAARDELLRRGIEPPVISDEWWLDVVEATKRLHNGFMYPPPGVDWGAWTFPLPHEYSVGSERGINIAWTALQMEWSDYAEELKLCQITEPSELHEFISQFSGLSEMCLERPAHVACYAPQLTIPEFSGFLSESFEAEMQSSIRKRQERRTRINDNGKAPVCDEEWSLRHPNFGNYKPASVAHFYIQGEMYAPKITCFETFEYIVWLLSRDSSWLPNSHREYLIKGSVDWAVWPGLRGEGYDSENALIRRLYYVKSPKSFKFTKTIRIALEDMVANALKNIERNDDVSRIADEFIERKYVEGWFALREQSKTRRRKKPLG